MARPLLLGHRGARAVASIPENTFESFDLALEHGCDGFEFDVRLTADGRSVICHDPRHHGIEIARADAGCLQEIPVLQNVLERYSRQAFLDIELKVRGLEDNTIAAIRDWPLQRGFVVSSFVPEVVQQLRARNPVIPAGIICDTREQLSAWHELPITHVMAYHKLLSRELVEELHGAGKKVFVWTVNRADDMVRFASWGVEGIISDDTQMLVGTLRMAG